MYVNLITMILSMGLISSTKNPVHAIWFVLSCFLSNICTLLLLHLDYIALIILIIYVGAILVLFIFIFSPPFFKNILSLREKNEIFTLTSKNRKKMMGSHVHKYVKIPV